MQACMHQSPHRHLRGLLRRCFRLRGRLLCSRARLRHTRSSAKVSPIKKMLP